MNTLLALILLLFTPSLQAMPLSGFLQLGVGAGGANLHDHTGGAHYRLHAGSGVAVSAGVLFAISPTKPHGFELQTGFGYHLNRDERNPSNGVTWSHFPFEAIYFYRNTDRQFRVGAGAFSQFAGRIDGYGSHRLATTNLKNSWGWLIAIEKLMLDTQEKTLSFGLRYQSIQMRSGRTPKPIDGSGFLLTVTVMTL